MPADLVQQQQVPLRGPPLVTPIVDALCYCEVKSPRGVADCSMVQEDTAWLNIQHMLDSMERHSLTWTLVTGICSAGDAQMAGTANFRRVSECSLLVVLAAVSIPD